MVIAIRASPEMNDMNDPRRRLQFLILPLLTVLSTAPVAQDNLNTTTQVGKVNINRTYQCGDENLNSTYQEGKVNINRTVQVCGRGAQERGLGSMRGSRHEPERAERAGRESGRGQRAGGEPALAARGQQRR